MVKVNGELQDVAGRSLAACLSELGYAPARIAVMRNDDVVPREAYETVRLEDGDVLEIVSFMGGGGF